MYTKEYVDAQMRLMDAIYGKEWQIEKRLKCIGIINDDSNLFIEYRREVVDSVIDAMCRMMTWSNIDVNINIGFHMIGEGCEISPENELIFTFLRDNSNDRIVVEFYRRISDNDWAIIAGEHIDIFIEEN